jgi:HPt (histidine-containing phosphotransfer) domain-containing protein
MSSNNQAPTPPTARAAAATVRAAKVEVKPMGADRSAAARRRAAAVLEVLAGARTPADAALAIGLSLAHYYHLEGRALRGLLTACEPAAPGRQPDPNAQARALQQRCQRLERELARQQALARLAQRTIGLAAPVPPKAAAAKKRKRRPAVRALRVAGQLRDGVAEAPAAESAAAAPAAARAGVAATVKDSD